MRYNLELYYLIKRMDRMEKAYFSKFAFKYNKEDSELDYLYRLIEKEVSKSIEINLRFELKIKKKATVRILSTKFSRVKKELMDLLLESIYKFQKSKNETEVYLHYLRRADVLLTKNLKSYAWKEIEKGLVKAVEAEHFEAAILLQKKQYIISAHLQDKEKISRSIVRQRLLASQLREKMDFQMLYEQVFRVHRSMGQDREQSLSEQFEKLMSDPILKKEKLLSNTTTYYKFGIQQVAAFTMKDEIRSLEFSERVLDLSLKHPKVFNRRPEALFPSVTNIISDSLSLGIISNYHQYRPWLERQKFTTDHLKMNQQYQLVKVDLYFANVSSSFEQVNVVEKRFKKLQKGILEGLGLDAKAILSHLFASCFFLAQDYKKSIYWINELLFLARKGEVRETNIIECELMLIAIHVEEMNIDILPNLIRSFQNRFLQKNKLHSREKVILDFLKKLIHCFHSKKEVRKLSASTMLLLEKIPHKVNTMDFNFLLWLKSLNDKRSYGMMIQEKNQKMIQENLLK